MNLVCLAAFCRLLSQWSKNDDVLFSTTVSQRPPEMASVIGCVVSVLPFRLDHSENTSFLNLLKQISEKAGEMQNNVVSEMIFRTSGIEKEEKVDFRNIEYNFLPADFRKPLEFSGVKSELVEMPKIQFESHELYFNVELSNDEMIVSIDFENKSFKRSTIIKIAEKFEAILTEAVRETLGETVNETSLKAVGSSS